MRLLGTRKNPKGPDIANAQNVEIDCNGTTVSFSAPFSNEKDSFGQNVFQKNSDKPSIKHQVDRQKTASRFSGGGLHSRSYSFFGLPVLDGYIGGLTFQVFFTQDNENKLLERFFEISLEFLNKTYSLKPKKPFFNWLYPIDWKYINCGNAKTLTYSIQDLTSLKRGSVRSIPQFVLPISSSICLNFDFEFSVAVNSGCLKEVTNIIKKVMDTLNVAYCEKHKIELEKANLQDKFFEQKTFIWEDYKKSPGVDHSILENYR